MKYIKKIFDIFTLRVAIHEDEFIGSLDSFN